MAEITIAQVAAQMVQQQGLLAQQQATIQQLHDRLRLAEATVSTLQDDASRSNRRGRMDDDEGKPKDLADKKFFTPPMLGSKSLFREWAEEFVEYLEDRDAELGRLLEKAAAATEQIDALGADDAVIA